MTPEESYAAQMAPNEFIDPAGEMPQNMETVEEENEQLELPFEERSEAEEYKETKDLEDRLTLNRRELDEDEDEDEDEPEDSIINPGAMKPMEAGDILAKKVQVQKEDDESFNIAMEKKNIPPSKQEEQVTALGDVAATKVEANKEAWIQGLNKLKAEWNQWTTKPMEAQQELFIDLAAYVIADKDESYFQGAKNIAEKVLNNINRAWNSLVRQVPRDKRGELNQFLGHNLGFTLTEAPMTEISKWGGYHTPISTTGKLLAYPTELAMLALGTYFTAGALGVTGTVPVLGAEAGMFMMAVAPDDGSMQDMLATAPWPVVRKLGFDYFQTDGLPHHQKMLRIGLEEFFYSAMLAGGAKVVGKVLTDPTIFRQVAKEKANLMADTLIAVKSARDSRDVLEASFRVVKEGGELSPPSGTIVEKAFGPKRVEKDIPQFTLKTEDPFIMEDSAIATMSRKVPKDFRGRSKDFLDSYEDETISLAEQKGAYDKTRVGSLKDKVQENLYNSTRFYTREIEGLLEEVDEYLTKPGVSEKKQPAIIPGEKQEIHKISSPDDVQELTETLTHLEESVHALTLPFELEADPKLTKTFGVFPFQLSTKGKAKLQMLHEKLNDDMDKYYFSNMTTEDLPLPYTDKRNPYYKKLINEIDQSYTAHEGYWETGLDLDTPLSTLFDNAAKSISDVAIKKGPVTAGDKQVIEGVLLDLGRIPYIDGDALITDFKNLTAPVEGVVDIKAATKPQLQKMVVRIIELKRAIKAHHTDVRKIINLVKGLPIEDMAPMDWMNKGVKVLGPIGFYHNTLKTSENVAKITNILRGKSYVDKDKFDEIYSVDARDALDVFARNHVINSLARQRAERGRKLLRYDHQMRKSEAILSKEQAAKEKQLYKMSIAVERAKTQKEALQGKLDYLKENFKVYKQKIKDKIIKQDKKFEIRQKLQMQRVKEQFDLIKEDIAIRDKKLAELQEYPSYLVDRPVEAKEGKKFVRIEKGKVVANLNEYNSMEDLEAAITEVKQHMYKNVPKEDKTFVWLLEAAWKKGEMLPPDIRNDVARRMGLDPDDLQKKSPYSDKYTKAIEDSWNGADLAAVMKIVESSWERVTRLARLAMENTKLTPDELIELQINPKTYDLVKKDQNLEALVLFKDEFEKFFYQLYPQVWRGLHGTPVLPAQYKFMSDKLTYLGKIESEVMKHGQRNFPVSTQGMFQIAAEIATIEQLGGKRGLSKYKQQLYIANKSRGPFWKRIVDSFFFVRSASMLSGFATSGRILTSGLSETSLKVGLEYPIEMGIRIAQGRSTMAQAKRELQALHAHGHIMAARMMSKYLIEHLADLKDIVNVKKHKKRDYNFTKPKFDPQTAHIDQLGYRDNPLRIGDITKDDATFLELSSDILAATYELPFWSIDTLDDVFKSVNHAYRHTILSMRQADIDAQIELDKHIAKIDEWEKTQPKNKNTKVEYHKRIVDFNVDEVRNRRYNYYLENPTPDMIKDIQKHYRQVTLLEDLKENGPLGNIYQAYRSIPGVKHMWPFLLTSLNSYKRRVETGLYRLPLEAAMLLKLSERKSLLKGAMAEKQQYLDQHFPHGTPARTPYDETIENLKDTSSLYGKNRLNILDYSLFDTSDPNKQAQTIARYVAATAVTGTAVYLASEGMFTGEEFYQKTHYQAAEKALNIQHESIFLQTGVGKDGARQGIYIPLRGEEPVGAFIKQAVNFYNLSHYLSQEQYEEAMTLFMYSTATAYTPEVFMEIARDANYVFDFVGSSAKKYRTQRAIDYLRKKTEMFFGAGVPIPEELVDLVPKDSRIERDGKVYAPLGMKAFIDDIRRTIDDEDDAFIQRETKVEKYHFTGEYQEELGVWQTITDAIYKSYRNRAPGISQELEPKLNFLGEEMRVAPKWGAFSMMAYMMPGNSFGDMLVRKDIENAPAPEVVRAWNTVDYNPEFKRFEITKESDDTMSILVDNLKLPKEEKPSVRIFAEMIRYGYENKWTSFIESDDSWKTKPIFDTITKSYGGKTGSIGLTHKQKNDIIRAVNQEKHPSYGNKTLKRALYEEMEFGYPSLPELKRYDKNARMELIDKMIADYSLLGKEKYMEAFQELEESIKYEATIER